MLGSILIFEIIKQQSRRHASKPSIFDLIDKHLILKSTVIILWVCHFFLLFSEDLIDFSYVDLLISLKVIRKEKLIDRFDVSLSRFYQKNKFQNVSARFESILLTYYSTVLIYSIVCMHKLLWIST